MTLTQTSEIMTIPGTFNQKPWGSYLIAANHSAHWLDNQRDGINENIRPVENSGNFQSAVSVDTWVHVYRIAVCHIHRAASLG